MEIRDFKSILDDFLLSKSHQIKARDLEIKTAMEGKLTLFAFVNLQTSTSVSI